jgi:hypothetical protein
VTTLPLTWSTALQICERVEPFVLRRTVQDGTGAALALRRLTEAQYPAPQSEVIERVAETPLVVTASSLLFVSSEGPPAQAPRSNARALAVVRR